MLYWEEVIEALGAGLSFRNSEIKSCKKKSEENAAEILRLKSEIERLKKENMDLKKENEKFKSSGEAGNINIFVKEALKG